jgi:hypothetical protein
MKKILLVLSMICALNIFAQTISQASVSELNVLTQYIMNQWGADATLEDALDDDEMSVSTFRYKGEIFKMIKVYSGDTAHGPVYLPKTLEIVGEMSDGDITIRGQWINYDDIDFSVNDIKEDDAMINDFFCGEMDPFVVGDVCIVNVTVGIDKKIAILFDFDSVVNEIEGTEIFIGRKAKIDMNKLSKIYDRDVLEVLKDFDEDYFYMNTNFDFFEVFDL